MFTTIREPKPYHVNLERQSFWAPATVAHTAHSTQKTKQPIPVSTPALKLQEESSADVKMNLSHLPAVHSSQSVDRLLSVDMATTSLAKPPPDKTKSFGKSRASHGLICLITDKCLREHCRKSPKESKHSVR